MSDNLEKFYRFADENMFRHTAQEEFAWNVWQAAIESVVVELPVTCCRTHVFEIPWTNEVGMEHDEYFEVEDIHKCLDAAGIKYK